MVQKINLRLLIFIIFVNLTYAQNNKNDLQFQQIALDQGLSQIMVNCIIQDRKGFIWIGTEDGLSRYDGYEFKVYRHDPNKLNSISNDYIRTIYEDDKGILWIGTYYGGLNRFDPEQEHFTSFQNDPNDPNSLSNNEVRTITQDSSRNLWIGTYGGGVNRLDTETYEFTHYTYNENNPGGLSNNYIDVLLYDNAGCLWIGSLGGGLDRLSFDTGKITNILNSKNGQQGFDYIRELHQYEPDNIWIGTSGAGVIKLNINSDSINQTKPIYTHYDFSTNDLSSNVINKILKDNNSESLWIGTFNGLFRFDVKSEQSDYYFCDITNPASISSNIIFDIIEDSGNNIWIGTGSGGINLIDSGKKKFKLYKNTRDNPSFISSNTIFSILEDHNEHLWIGTMDGGLNILNRNRDTSKIYTNIPGDNKSLSQNYVRSIYQDKKGSVWIGTMMGLNKTTFQTINSQVSNSFTDKIQFERYFLFSPDSTKTPGDLSITCITEDINGNLWIGTFGGIVMLDPNTNKFIRYKHNDSDSTSLSSNSVSSIIFDHENFLWVGTEGGGLNKSNWRITDKLNQYQNLFTHYYSNHSKSNSLFSNHVLSIFEGPNNKIWVGTTEGLSRFDRKSESFKTYNTKSGLLNDFIYSIIDDEQENLWLSTNKGISKFNPTTEVFSNYTYSDGLQNDEFNIATVHKGQKGELFFGGIDGFNAFTPKDIVNNQFVPPVYIVDFELSNKSVQIRNKLNQKAVLSKSIISTEKLELSYKDKMFSFKFSALNYTNSYENQYAYMLEGFDDDWIYTGNKRYATYTNIDPGKYIFKVKGSNNDGIWNDDPTILTINISPPFWDTWWFKMTSLLLFIGIIYTLYKRRIKYLSTQKRFLEKEVLEKRETANRLQTAINEVEKLKDQLEAENIYLQSEIKYAHNFENIITQNNNFKNLLGNIEKVAITDSTVLILGESGTGKELIARAVHNISHLKNKPLVKVDCGTLPIDLIESELFGHEKGAFTGATSKKIGRFELADEGTIFLDEVGNLPFEIQTKLLRIIQDGEFERLGGSGSIKINVRIIAATNRNLYDAVKREEFREDLYYRLNVFPLNIPPLRERIEDIPLLVKYFMKLYCKKIGKKELHITKNLINKLQKYPWPGNVRELENVIERSVILSDSNKLVVRNLTNKFEVIPLEEIERKHIIQVLEYTNWRVSGPKGAAKLLGLKPSTLEFRMKKLDISRPK